MTQDLLELHKRNGLLVLLLWICTTLGIVSTIDSMDGVLSIAYPAIPICLLSTFLYWKKLFIPQIKLLMVIGINIISFSIMSMGSAVTNSLVLYLGLAFCSLYMDRFIMILNGIIGLALLNYFGATAYVGADIVGLNTFYIVVLLTLIGQSTVGTRMLGNMNASMNEANEAKERVELLINEARTVSATLNTSGKELNENAVMAGKINAEVLAAFHEMSAGIESQASSVSDISSAMESLNDSVQRTFAASETTSEKATIAAELTKEGQDQITDLAAKMHQVSELVDNTAVIMEKVNSENVKIGGILSSIEEIAKQTNLLSFNASIEAARAGEHGRGFAVVAEEIRQLAQLTHRASSDIADILSSIQSNISSAAVRITDGQTASRSGAESADIITALFVQINTNTKEVMDQSDHLLELNIQLQSASTQITDEISSVSSVTEQSAASVEEVLASAELQQHRVNEIVVSIQKLNETAQAMEKTLQDSNS
ncbi:methyl-accepting chemotaxis protein [Paenibacillus provencensis]|uniref:Methyl-accepting chemotaxis protein n=1 Tax=Paenibacillus provencensis TaxID=441151 RepID=A0ABW3PWS1_9BACL|nr:methyl-accepting chemotaxis protein [Paenibacillus sp. MER 78]MCM3128040.1 methyl-accepting chemotaxis protein [Paenibacillus sp. MER 78]